MGGENRTGIKAKCIPMHPSASWFPGSSIVEHSAFDRMLGVCEVKSGLQVREAKALFVSQSDVNDLL